MNRELIVTLLKKNIQELNMITDGFMEMTEFPKPIILLAQHKVEDIQIQIQQLADYKIATQCTTDTTPALIESTEVENGVIDSGAIGSGTIDSFIIERQVAANSVIDTQPVTTVIPETYANTQTLPETVSAEITESGTLVAEENSLIIPIESAIEFVFDEQTAIILTEDVDDEENDDDEEDDDEDDFEEDMEDIEEENEEDENIVVQKIGSKLTKATTIEENKNIIAEKTATTPQSRNETLSKADNSISSLLGNKKIDDIKQAINIGDRFRFQRELFKGNGEDMNKTLSYINQLATFREVESFLQSKYSWNTENEAVNDFYHIAKRRFM